MAIRRRTYAIVWTTLGVVALAVAGSFTFRPSQLARFRELDAQVTPGMTAAALDELIAGLPPAAWVHREEGTIILRYDKKSFPVWTSYITTVTLHDGVVSQVGREKAFTGP